MKKVGIIKNAVQILLEEASGYLPARYIERVVDKLRQNPSFKICNISEIDAAELRKNYTFVGTEKQLKRLIGSVTNRNTINLPVAKAIHEVAMEEKIFINSIVPTDNLATVTA